MLSTGRVAYRNLARTGLFSVDETCHGVRLALDCQCVRRVRGAASQRERRNCYDMYLHCALSPQPMVRLYPLGGGLQWDRPEPQLRIVIDVAEHRSPHRVGPELTERAHHRGLKTTWRMPVQPGSIRSSGVAKRFSIFVMFSSMRLTGRTTMPRRVSASDAFHIPRTRSATQGAAIKTWSHSSMGPVNQVRAMSAMGRKPTVA